ncbi:MAG: hypothetical protein S4CHLAM20_09610 [Chlamydiia bacterium]|nr:hypothetical protein [Chlamydiia bacterium]
MKQHLKLCLKRYFIILSLITFSSIILSPDLKLDSLDNFQKSTTALFFYRFNIFSIFSLLFATLTTIQSFERENLNVALSISGIHSFKLMRPVLLFGLLLTLVSLTINEFFLPSALKQLKKDAFLSSYNNNFHINRVDNEIFFFQKDLKNFTFIDKDKNILYAKNGEYLDTGFKLLNVDKFEKHNHQYKKTISMNEVFLPFNHSLIKKPSQIKISASLSTLFNAFLNKQDDEEMNFDRLKTTLAYRVFLPLLNVFAVAIATVFGFHQTFRRRYYLSLGVVLFLSLFAFYILECSAILGNGGVISPLLFITVASSLFVFTPLIAYVKKV